MPTIEEQTKTPATVSRMRADMRRTRKKLFMNGEDYGRDVKGWGDKLV